MNRCPYPQNAPKSSAYDGKIDGRFWKIKQPPPSLTDITFITQLGRPVSLPARGRPCTSISVRHYISGASYQPSFPIFYDYRPADLQLDRFTSAAIDLVKLPFADASIDSLSCMHVVEHIGLGRYGDALDPVGDLTAMLELQRVSVARRLAIVRSSVGKSRICFNAHRIYSFHQVRAAFIGLELKDFAPIPDRREQGGLIHDASEDLVNSQEYGCGCFWFLRRRGGANDECS